MINAHYVMIVLITKKNQKKIKKQKNKNHQKKKKENQKKERKKKSRLKKTKRKIKRKKLAEKLREEYNDDAPETLEEIIKFPGIGRKIGLLYLKECCQQVEGVAVDTHIHKIANRLKWVNNTKDPNKTSIELEKIID